MTELEMTIDKLKTGKAASLDVRTIEMMKYLEGTETRILLELLNKKE